MISTWAQKIEWKHAGVPEIQATQNAKTSVWQKHFTAISPQPLGRIPRNLGQLTRLVGPPKCHKSEGLSGLGEVGWQRRVFDP